MEDERTSADQVRMRPSIRLLAPLLLLLGAAVSGTGQAPAAVIPTPNVANLPAAVQPLVQRMEQLQVNSERYLQTIRVSATETVRAGRHRRRLRHVSEATTMFGEASLSPLRARVRKHNASGPVSMIGVGPVTYVYTPGIAKRDGNRPWIRVRVGAEALFPYHGLSSPDVEAKAGGTGTYAGLINLLATAAHNVSIAGPAVVDGQQTTELRATVPTVDSADPHGVPGEDGIEHLVIFVSEAGLPVRVILSSRLDHVGISETTDILAVNVPISVKAPPRRRTIGPVGLSKLPEPKRRLTARRESRQ